MNWTLILFSVGNTAETDVKIYIINESNRVKFLFVNDFTKVDSERDFVSLNYMINYYLSSSCQRIHLFK
jgi:hypothetical protein